MLYFVSDPESESESEPESESIRSPESEPESEQPHHDSAPLLRAIVYGPDRAVVSGPSAEQSAPITSRDLCQVTIQSRYHGPDRAVGSGSGSRDS